MEVSSVMNCRLVNLPRILDERGNLTFIEQDLLSFQVARAYWVYDVPGGESRDGHALKRGQEFFIALSGSFDIELNDGFSSRTVPLNRSYYGLFVPNLVWRHLTNFSTNAVCLVLASTPFLPEDYIRNLSEYLGYKNPEKSNAHHT